MADTSIAQYPNVTAAPSRQSEAVRFLILEAGEGGGGTSMFLYYLLKALDRSKFDPVVAFYFRNDGPDLRFLRELDVPIFFILPKTRHESVPEWLAHGKSLIGNVAAKVLRRLLHPLVIDIPLICRIAALVKQQRIQLVVTNNDLGLHFWGAVAARISGTPIVSRKAGGVGEKKWFKSWLTPWVSVFVSVSKSTEVDQLRNNPSSKRVITIHEGVDLSRFGKSPRTVTLLKEFGIPANTKVVTSISRFDVGKGQLEFIRAAAEILVQERDVRFLIVGAETPQSGPITAELHAEVSRLGIEQYVIFAGWRSDIPDILAITDIFVHCPTTCIEGLGIANLEAMAAGKPTVVSENGGLSDAVIDGVTGVVTRPGNICELAAAILKLLREDKLREQFGAAGRLRVEEEFDIERNARKLEAVFQECLL